MTDPLKGATTEYLLEKRIKELEREVLSKQWRINALEAQVEEKEAWRDVENKANQELEAENDRLRDELDGYHALEDDMSTEMLTMAELAKENAELRAERDRLREALEDVASTGMARYCASCGESIRIARTALAGKDTK